MNSAAKLGFFTKTPNFLKSFKNQIFHKNSEFSQNWYENRIFFENMRNSGIFLLKSEFERKVNDFGTIISIIIILFELKYKWSLFLVSFQRFWLILVQNNSKLTNWDQNMLSSAKSEEAQGLFLNGGDENVSRIPRL